MTKLIEFKNLNFAYDDEHAFKDFNMTINEEDIVTMIGTGASGKTTLLNMLCNRIKTDALYYKKMNIKTYNPEDLQSSIVVIFDEPTTETFTKDEICKFVNRLHVPEEQIDERLQNLNEFFPIVGLFNKKIAELSKEQLELVKILRYLIINPVFLAIDMCLGNLTILDKRLFFEYIKKNHITLLNVTTDLNETLFGDKIFVIDNFEIILEGPTFSILKTDTILKRLGLKLPLAVNLSLCLNNYDVLQKIYKENEKLVNALWK